VEPGKWPAILQFLWALLNDKVRFGRLIYLIFTIVPVAGIFLGVSAGLVYLMLMHAAVADKVGITVGSSVFITLGSLVLKRVWPRHRRDK
jgi:hypothetical protein